MDTSSELQRRLEIAHIYVFGTLEGMPVHFATPADASEPREFTYLQASRFIQSLMGTIERGRPFEKAKARILLEDRDYYFPGTREETWAAVDAAFAQ